MLSFLRRVKHFIKAINLKWRNLTFRPYVKRKAIEGIKFDFLIGNIEGRERNGMH
jgi:hypothetical protein